MKLAPVASFIKQLSKNLGFSSSLNEKVFFYSVS